MTVMRRFARPARPDVGSVLALCLTFSLALGWTLGAPAPVRAVEDLGAVDFPTSGEGEAQAHFVRGVAALHSFWYPEAEEELRRAREVDPGFVMAYWGEAMTHNHPVWDQVELEAGREALERLAPTAEERLAMAPTERERAYLAAVEILFFGEGDKPARDRAYEAAMGRLAERYPEDPEAAIFHALAIEGLAYGDGDPELRFDHLMEAAAILEELFDDAPDHPGVLHYLIHAYDDPVHAPLGLRAARIYAEVAPAAPHALHMPSHIFVQLGRWERAEASNVDAWQASVDWVRERDLSPDHRDFHSLDWLLYARLQRGSWEKARQTLETVREADAAGGGDRVDWYRADMEARYAIERRSPSPPPEEVLGSERRAAGPWLAAALAAYSTEDADGARKAADRLAALAAEEGGGPVAVMARAAEGLALLAEGRGEDGLRTLSEAAELEEGLEPPSGPPDTVKPAHELYGEALLAHGRPEEAARQLEISLRRTPRRALSLLAAARAAAALERRDQALEHYREYLAVRGSAGPGVPGIDEARAYIEAAEADAGSGPAAASDAR
jgi:tetratricopeptide (TPR) repeat protein